MNVLVTGARLPAALEIVRAVARAGARVWAADTFCLPMTRFSRFAQGYLRFPAPAADFVGFRKAVLGAIVKQRIDLIVPGAEEVFYLAAMSDNIASHARLFAEPLPRQRSLHSKRELLGLARKCPVLIPATRRARSRAEVSAALAKMGETVVKPEFSRGGFESLFRPDEKQISNLQISEQRPWLVQQYVRGAEFCSYEVARDRKLLAHSCYRPRYRAGRGSSLYFEPAAHDSIRAFAAAFVGEHSLTGQFGFDFIKEPGGGLYLLECNPRATSGVHLFGPGSALGQAFLGGDVTCEIDGVPRFSLLAVTALHGLAALREGMVGELLRDVRRAKDPAFDPADPLPFCLQGLAGVEVLWRNRRERLPFARALTRDLEWDGGPIP